MEIYKVGISETKNSKRVTMTELSNYLFIFVWIKEKLLQRNVLFDFSEQGID